MLLLFCCFFFCKFVAINVNEHGRLAKSDSFGQIGGRDNREMVVLPRETFLEMV